MPFFILIVGAFLLFGIPWVIWMAFAETGAFFTGVGRFLSCVFGLALLGLTAFFAFYFYEITSPQFEIGPVILGSAVVLLCFSLALVMRWVYRRLTWWI